MLRTDRLVVRPWRDEDRTPWAAMNADPEVMRYLGPPLDRAAADAMLDRLADAIARQGWGLWAVEVVAGDGPEGFVGFTGLSRPRFDAAFTPCVEVGWRLARAAWGNGYATEAAGAALGYAFDVLGLDEVVSFTTVANARSRAVMERLGMTRDPADDFDHPNLAADDPLRPHALYRLTADEWRAAAR
jgi:RimJ/RimL family protein N-acetyltransferase